MLEDFWFRRTTFDSKRLFGVRPRNPHRHEEWPPPTQTAGHAAEPREH